MREIARIRLCPAQVVTYKYGALQIMHWREELQKKLGLQFSVKEFHDRILNHGSLPFVHGEKECVCFITEQRQKTGIGKTPAESVFDL